MPPRERRRVTIAPGWRAARAPPAPPLHRHLRSPPSPHPRPRAIGVVGSGAGQADERRHGEAGWPWAVGGGAKLEETGRTGGVRRNAWAGKVTASSRWCAQHASRRVHERPTPPFCGRRVRAATAVGAARLVRARPSEPHARRGKSRRAPWEAPKHESRATCTASCNVRRWRSGAPGRVSCVHVLASL